VLATGVFGPRYRELLARSRVVFNRSIRGECNQRVFEAAASGCLLFQEAGNPEVPLFLEPGREYVEYTDADLEDRLEHSLSHEGEPRAVAEAGRRRAQGCSFQALWDQALAQLEADWPELHARAHARQPLEPRAPEALQGRLWQALCTNLGS